MSERDPGDEDEDLFVDIATEIGRIEAVLKRSACPMSPREIADAIGVDGVTENIRKALRRLGATGRVRHVAHSRWSSAPTQPLASTSAEGTPDRAKRRFGT